VVKLLLNIPYVNRIYVTRVYVQLCGFSQKLIRTTNKLSLPTVRPYHLRHQADDAPTLLHTHPYIRRRTASNSRKPPSCANVPITLITVKVPPQTDANSLALQLSVTVYAVRQQSTPLCSLNLITAEPMLSS